MEHSGNCTFHPHQHEQTLCFPSHCIQGRSFIPFSKHIATISLTSMNQVFFLMGSRGVYCEVGTNIMHIPLAPELFFLILAHPVYKM